MPVLDLTNFQKVEEYKSFLKESNYHSVTQDLAWGHVKNTWIKEYVYIEENGQIIAAISLLIKKVFGGHSLMYAPRGPVCNIYNIDIVKKLLKEVEPIAKKYKAFVLKMDPEVKYSEKLNELYANHGFIVKSKDAKVDELIQTRNNMILYLENHDADSIMTKFSKKNRNEIRSSSRKGVYVTWDRTDEYIEKFFGLYTFMAERNEITHRDIDYFYRMRDAFGEQLRIYIAHHEGDNLAGAITINYYGKLYYLYAGSNNTKRNKYPNNLLNYEMIKWGIEEGASQYDMGGVFSMDENDGLYRFKKQFCNKDGVTEYIGEIDFIYSKLFYYLYDHAIPSVKKLRKKLNLN